MNGLRKRKKLKTFNATVEINLKVYQDSSGVLLLDIC